MELRLAGKTAIVTGGGSQVGYGRAICLALAREGCNVVVADIDLVGAQLTATDAERFGVKAIAVEVNVTVPESVKKMVRQTLDTFGSIDILVNNAGASSSMKPLIEKTLDEIMFDIQVNLLGHIIVIKEVVPIMLKQGKGRIINFSGGQGIPNLSTYGAAKAGVEALTRAIARELAPHGIIVNAVAPGLARTGLTRDAPAEFFEAYKKTSALSRLCKPDDVAPVVVFLASDACTFIVGQTIRISATP